MSLKIKQTRVGEIASVSYHYTPTEDTSAAIVATAGSSRDINGTSGKLNVVTGIKRDSKGHIVGVTCANIYSSGSSGGGVDNPGATCNCEVVGEYDTTGLVRNGSTITTITSDIGYIPCPIVDGVPYYQNTIDTTGVKTDVSSKLYLIGTTKSSGNISETYRNTNVYAIGSKLCAPVVSGNLSGTAEKVNSNTTTSTYYLCGSTSASTSASGTLVKRSTVYVNTNGSLVAPTFVGNLSGDHVKTPTLHLYNENVNNGYSGGKIVFGDVEENDLLDNHGHHYVCIEEIEDDKLNFKATNFNFEMAGDGQFNVTGGHVVAPTLHLYNENVEGGYSGGKIVFGNTDDVENHDSHYTCIEEIEDNTLTFSADRFYFERGDIFCRDLFGTATTATSLSVSGAVGSTTKPVYFNASGRPVACSFTVSKSVPSNASFSDVNVTNNSTTSTYYLCGSTSSGNTTGTLVKRSDVYVDTSGNLNAKSFCVHASTKITSDTSYNIFFNVNGESPLVIANDKSSNIFVAPGSSYSNKYSLGTSSRKWKDVYATTFYGNLSGTATSATTANSAYTAEAAGTAEVANTANTATTATCLADKSKGSATNPVYINASGRPVACTYSLSKSVPSNAVFTDTKNTVGAATTASKLYFIGTTTSTSGDSQQSYKNVSVCVDGTALYAAGGFYESSDERLKDFSNKIDADLDKISKIKKHKFTWKDSENKNEEIGVSAQEIRELYPEIVSENEEGYLSVAYDKLAVVALAAIDELHKKNKELEARIELLESKLLN